MADDLLQDIVTLCQVADSKAAMVYERLARQAQDPELAQFWSQRSEEEREHVGYWERLEGLAERGMIPQIFDRPVEIRSDLENVDKRTDEYLADSEQVSDAQQAFLLAYHMEFAMLHPAFITLLHFARAVPGGLYTPEEQYDLHLNELTEGLTHFGVTSPELTLIGQLIRQLWRQNRMLTMQSFTDSLTGILNRRGFFEMARPFAFFAKRTCASVGLLMIDIDRFKKVNEQYGHQQGDHILRTVAGILGTHTRRSDLLSRYGGEEFVLFLSSVEADALFYVCEKLRTSVEEATRDWAPVTISIGAVHRVIHQHVEDELRQLIRRADENLQQAKAQGRNRTVCSG